MNYKFGQGEKVKNHIVFYVLFLIGCENSSPECDISKGLLSPCYTQEYSQCDTPKDNLNILFKPKDPIHPFGHSFCIVCNPDIGTQEYEDWALEMGAPSGPSNTNDVHPCLYAYASQTNMNSLEECRTLICDGGATYNDMVGKNNENIDVSPILQ